MTRVLSELLGADEPMFHQGLMRLEAASGHANTDIRLSAEVSRATKLKLRALGLDPADTTGAELYAALLQRVKADDERLTKVLLEKYGQDGAIHATLGKALADLPVPKSVFAMRQAVAKKLLAKQPPKQAMKVLGYRSFDSMVRREPVLAVFAAGWLLEANGWRKSIVDSYKKLQASDFELRTLTILAPENKRWQALATTVVAQKKHTVLGFKELGAVVILPFPEEKPPAMNLATLLVALHEMNEIRSASTFLKLNQVRPDFGRMLHDAMVDEPKLSATLLDGQVPWRIIQRYYSRFGSRFREELFEPHVQKEDVTWHSIEKALASLDPGLEFWHHTAALGILHDHQPVSMNIIDAALSLCNELPYAHRIVQYFRHNLWSELLIRYLKHDSVEQAVTDSIEPSLVDQA